MAYPRKVKKTWLSQLYCHLLSIRIQVCILDDGLYHLNRMVLVRKKTTDGPLGDGTHRHHQNFTSFVAGFGRRRLLLFVAHKDDRSFLKGTIVFPFIFPFWWSFPDDFGSWCLSLFLRVATNTCTKALCLVASIFAKGKWRKLDKKTERKWREEVRK